MTGQDREVTAVDIVLIRHGAEKSKILDKREPVKTTPLSEEGQEQVSRLKDTLAHLELQPEVFLTSCGYKRVDETAERLSAGTSKPVHPIMALNPLEETGLTNENILEEIITQAKDIEVDLSQKKTVALVGHGPTLNLILTCLTSQRVRLLDRSEAVWAQADCLLDFLRGKGKIYCRIPVADYQEDELRPKVQSKMTVSTFLAGFAFTVLFAILASQVKTPGTNISPWELAAVVFLTAAFGFFTVAVYIYDQLSMPEGFWQYDSEGGRRILFWRIRIPESWRGKRFKVDRRERGPLYAYMLWTWRIFTLGVVFGILGFISMLLSTVYPSWVKAVGSVVLLLVVLGYWFVRPPVSTD